MENISDVYNKLKKICDVCWVGDEHDFIYIYSCEQKYRLFVSSDILYVEKKYRIFKWEYWDSFTHIHTEFYKSDAQFFNKLLELCSKKNLLVVKNTMGINTIKVISKEEFKTKKRRYKSNLFRKCHIINFNSEK